jgi:uncharacterized protein YecE (DUF72 family)
MPEAIGNAVRVGIGGWNYAPWRDNFYPKDLPQKRELEYASRRLGSIEINSTFYGSQKPASFARWYAEVPEDFVFAVKGPRFATNRRDLAEAGPSIERFFASGVMELREKLGPINWQFLPARKFEPAEFDAFLGLLPREIDGRALRHAIEVRHRSFESADFLALLRKHEVAGVFTDKEGVPQMFDPSASFVYLRLQRSSEDVETGYPVEALDAWAGRIRSWASGGAPADLPRPDGGAAAGAPDTASPREVFVYLIDGFKPRAPAAAVALIERLADSGRGGSAPR